MEGSFHSAQATLERLDGFVAFAETVRSDGLDSMALRATDVSSPHASTIPSAGLERPSVPAPDLEPIRVLADGGMGRVLLARQASLQREVAVKTVRPDLTTPGLTLALLEEARITGSLEHPNIIPVHALGGDGSSPFLVMKRVDGVEWSTLLDDAAHPAWQRLAPDGADRLTVHIEVLRAVCDAAHFAHRQGVLHRDIKPSNVMIGELGEVYLVDWGVATALDPEDARYRKEALGFAGTPAFVAPEMISDDGGSVDARSDVYLLGATLHRVLVGEPRHHGTSLMAVFAEAAASEPVSYPAHVPEELGAIANRACSQRPEHRYPSAAALGDALRDFLRHRASVAISNRARERLEAFVASNDRVAKTPEARAQRRERRLECLFGFTTALDAWPGNAVAQRGLRECRLWALREEIADGNLAGAEAASLALGADLPPGDRDALEALRRESAERELGREQLRALAERQSWSRSAGARTAFFVLAAALGTGLWLWANGGHLTSSSAIPPADLAGLMGAAFAFLAIAVALLRRQLFATQANEQLAVGVVFVAGAMFANRVAHLWPAPHSAAMVSNELTLGALALAMGGLSLARWLWILVPPWVLAVGIVRAFPTHAGLVFATTAVASLAFGLWRASRAQRTDSVTASTTSSDERARRTS